MDDPPIKGECRSCGNEYDIQIYHVSLEDRFADYVDQPCPKCSYDPNIKETIKKIIDRNVCFQVHPRSTTCNGSKTDITVNVAELTDLVTKAILDYWPKGDKK